MMRCPWRVAMGQTLTLLRCAVVAFAAGCSGFQSALDPKGPRAEAVSTLHWSLVAVSTVVYVIVIGALIYALWRGSRRTTPDLAHVHRETVEQADTMKRGVAVATAVTVIVMLSFVFASVSTGRAVARVVVVEPQPA